MLPITVDIARVCVIPVGADEAARRRLALLDSAGAQPPPGMIKGRHSAAAVSAPVPGTVISRRQAGPLRI